MKNISITEIHELFDKSIAETFNSKYINHDSIDRTEAYGILTAKVIKDFYLTVSLGLIEKYLREKSKS